MNIIATCKVYLAINILMALVGLILFTLLRVSRIFPRKMRYGHLLKLGYGLVGVAIVTPFVLIPYLPCRVWAPQAQVWSALSKKSLGLSDEILSRAPVAISLGSTVASIHLDSITVSLMALLILGCLFVGVRLFYDSKILARILRESFLLKKIGRVAILASDDPIIPFSAWVPFRSYVVIPQNLVGHHDRFKMVIKHELQHHRQKDTKWIYGIQMVKALCFWNPLVYVLQKQLADLQEVACDEALTGHQKVSSLAYCDCLLWVAQQTLLSRATLVGTAGFTRGSAAKLLKWRIEEMLNVRTKYVSGLFAVGAGIVATGFLAVATAATQSSIQDRRISRADATKMVEVAQSDEFPVVVNDLVLEQLNRYLGTPDGRKFIKGSLARMKAYEADITKALDQYGLPHELLAVPLIEAGYKNYQDDGNRKHGAGLWMFMAQTARNYGLKVDSQVDQRLDVALETDAAVRHLGGLNLQFKDWGLALLAYNAGAGAVVKGISETGSHDVWTIIRKGYSNDLGYVAAMMAAVLIMKNPSCLD